MMPVVVTMMVAFWMSYHIKPGDDFAELGNVAF